MVIMNNRFKRELTEYFTLSEIKCKCGCPVTIIDDFFLANLIQLREMWKKPIVPNCVYRCPIHNKAVGGDAESFHQVGEAADLPLPDKDREVFIQMCQTIFPYTKLYDTFIHVAMRNVWS